MFSAINPSLPHFSGMLKARETGLIDLLLERHIAPKPKKARLDPEPLTFGQLISSFVAYALVFCVTFVLVFIERLGFWKTLKNMLSGKGA